MSTTEQQASRIVGKVDLQTIGVSLRLLVIFALGWLPALIDLKAVQSTAALYPLAITENPYFVPKHGVKLYVWTPLVVMSACLLFISPGLFLSLALNSAKRISQWLFTGIGLSIIVVSVTTGIIQSLMGSTLRGGNFAALVVVTSLLCFGFLLIRIARGHKLTKPFGQPHNGTIILSILGATFLFLIILTPKLYWENFNPDGVEAFQVGRLLLVHPVPFWPRSAGWISQIPDITMMLFAFPMSWFIRFFGECEASARLPFLLYIVALYGVVLSLIEEARTKPVGRINIWLIWLGLAIYSVVVFFSTTYNPYNADVASPGNYDTLLMVCFLGFVFGFLRKEYSWMIFFLCLSYLSSPAGLLLVGLWLLAVILVWKPKPWRRAAITVTAIIGCKVMAVIVPGILSAMNLPTPGDEHSGFNMLSKFYYLQFSDWHRFAFLVVPSGIIPAFALVLWKRQDQVARALTIVTLIYFSLFYIMLYVVHHYFVPSMLLPLIVFYRYDFMHTPRYWILTCASVVVVGIASLLISLPKNIVPNMSARLVGETIEDRLGGYEDLDPVSFRRSSILRHLFGYGGDPVVPSEIYGGESTQWYYYANRTGEGTRDTNYVIQLSNQPKPVGMRLIAQEDGVSLFVRSDRIWAEHQALRPPTPAESPIYYIQRDMLFPGRPIKNCPKIIELREILKRFGLDNVKDTLFDMVRHSKKQAPILNEK